MELDTLVISLVDSEASIGLFKNQLSEILGISPSSVLDVRLDSEQINGLVKHCVLVTLADEFISKEKLLELPFDGVKGDMLVFKVGDSVL